MNHRDIVCFSHLRWDHVFQRPHHLMSLAARDRRVFYVEEPAAGPVGLDVRQRGDVTVVTPLVPDDIDGSARISLLRRLVDELVERERIEAPVRWHLSPPMVSWSRRVAAAVVVYDAMDELSTFLGAPPDLVADERRLLREADVVFTGGRSLYEAQKHLHDNTHAFPSAVDAEHFRTARQVGDDPPDQAPLPRPRLGWFGVIDERFDAELVDAIAASRPEWSLVLVGPVSKIDPGSIPARPNIHWLGQRSYEELPRYLAGWDVAIMPFARNDATRFISPTKTPEYLAGGRPVVSTAIADVVTPYGDAGLVRIADDADTFIAACEAAMADVAGDRLARVDAFLEGMSWEATWAHMDAHLRRAEVLRQEAERRSRGAFVSVVPRVMRSRPGRRTIARRG
jgi:UDP-galactopyranose mutase